MYNRSHTYKIKYVRLIVILAYLLLPVISSGDLLSITGKYSHTSHLYLKYRISNKKRSAAKSIKIFIPQNSSNGINSQSISSIKHKFYPKPDYIKTGKDNYNNPFIQAFWFKPPKKILYESSFLSKNLLNIKSINCNQKYPAFIRTKNWYLKQTRIADHHSRIIRRLVYGFTKKYTNQYKLITSIINWINNNIKYKPSSSIQKASHVLLYKQASKKGLINLALAMIRAARIPARCVTGISVDKSLSIFLKNKKSKIEYRLMHPKNLYQWIEVYFPNASWLPIDLFKTTFFINPHLVKVSVSPDSDYRLIYTGKHPEEIKVINNIFYDIKHIYNHLKTLALIKNRKKIMLISRFNKNKTMIKHIKNLWNKTNSIQSENKPDRNIINKDAAVYIPQNNINPCMQQFTILSGKAVKSISLPVIKFSGDTSDIWINIHKNKKNNLPQKKPFISSKKNKLYNLPYTKPVMAKFTFYQPLKLMPGKYWITLKLEKRKNVTLFWKASINNSFDNSYNSLTIRGNTIIYHLLNFIFTINH